MTPDEAIQLVMEFCKKLDEEGYSLQGAPGGALMVRDREWNEYLVEPSE